MIMQFRNTVFSYGIVAKSLHWLVALMIIAAWGVGMYMAGLPEADSNRSLFFELHKSVGMSILLLVVIRWAWRLYNIRPRDPQIPRLMVWAAHSVHYALYVFMLVQPLSGWALSSAAGYAPTFFGLFTFPALVDFNPAMVRTYATVHDTSAWILFTLFVLHVGGALYHYFIVKDDTVQRML